MDEPGSVLIDFLVLVEDIRRNGARKRENRDLLDESDGEEARGRRRLGGVAILSCSRVMSSLNPTISAL